MDSDETQQAGLVDILIQYELCKQLEFKELIHDFVPLKATEVHKKHYTLRDVDSRVPGGCPPRPALGTALVIRA
jgi:hypothetical protein